MEARIIRIIGLLAILLMAIVVYLNIDAVVGKQNENENDRKLQAAEPPELLICQAVYEHNISKVDKAINLAQKMMKNTSKDENNISDSIQTMEVLKRGLKLYEEVNELQLLRRRSNQDDEFKTLFFKLLMRAVQQKKEVETLSQEWQKWYKNRVIEWHGSRSKLDELD